MSKQYKPNIVRGGVAVPLGNNYFFMKGRKHKQGGIDVGKDLEVEDGEVMKLTKDNIKVFSAVPFLNGQSPVEKLLGGEDPNKVFAQQERFKKVNKINDDGTNAQLGKGKKITTTEIPESQQYAVTTPDGQRKVFNSKQEASDYVTANTPKGYSLYDTTNYGTNIDKGQTAILNRNTEREIEKATKQEELAKARLTTIQQNKEASKEMLSYMPVIGDGMDLYQLGKDAYNGNYLNAGIGLGLLALPNVIEKPIKYIGKSIKKLFTKANKKSNVKFTDNFDINKNNKSYEELAEEYTDSWFDLGIKSSKDINAKNLQNITDDEWDKLYNEAIKNNDVEEAQRLRDLHFKSKTFNNKTIDNYGLPIHNYHGGQKGINIFFNSKDNLNYKNTKHQGYSHPETRIGIYFSPDKEIAKNYKRTYGKKGEIYDTYLKMDNPYIQKYSTTLLNRVKNLLFRDKYFDPAIIRNYRLNKELKGFDGVSHGDFENIVWDNKNIKLADPITYDDNGKIIPLSKRDDFTNPDIRYSWLLPTIGATTGLSLLSNNDQNVKRFGGKINKFRNGGDITPEEEALWKANNTVKPASNYHAAKDMNITKTREDFTDFVQRNFPNCPTGLSNCTLTASQFFGDPIGRAHTIVTNPKENNLYSVNEEHAIPGTMVIASDPLGTVNPKYHTMILSGYADKDYPFEYNGIKYNIKKGEPLVHYSKGKNNKESYKKNIPLRVYNDQSEGKTYNRYYRPYDKNGLPNVLLPELIVTNKKVMGGNHNDKNGKWLQKNGKIVTIADKDRFTDKHDIYPMSTKVIKDGNRKTIVNVPDTVTGPKILRPFVHIGRRMTNTANEMFKRNKKPMGGNHKLNTNQMANIYRVDSNGKTTWGMNFSTGGKSKGKIKAELGLKTKNDGSYYGYPKKDNKGNTWYIPTDEDLKLMYPGLAEDVDYNTLSDYDKKRYDEREGVREGYRVLPTGGVFYSDNETIFVNDEIDVNREIPNSKLRRKYYKSVVDPNINPLNPTKDDYHYMIYGKRDDKDNVKPSPKSTTPKQTTPGISATVATPKSNVTTTTPKQTAPNNVTRTAPRAKSTSQETPIFGLDAQNAFKKSIVGSKANPDYIRGTFDFRDNKELVNKIDPNTIKVDSTNIKYKGAPSNGNYFKNYNAGDYISLGANVLGNIGSALINKHTLDNMEYASAPVPKMAIKQKTNFNINPQLDLSRERLREGVSDINTNTASSSTALNRNNKLRLANIMNTNQLYGTKENMETQLINADRMNQQNVFNSNIDAFNTWNKEKNIFETAKQEKYGENKVGTVQGISQAVHDFINNNEKRRQFNNSLISIMAANPNVNPELYKVLGADWATDERIRNWKLANNYKV